MKKLIILFGLLLAVNISYSQDWKARLDISASPLKSELSVTVGVDSAGSGQYDTGLDTLPAPPGLTYYGYLNSGLASPYTFLKSGIRSSASDAVRWSLIISNAYCETTKKIFRRQ